jgi:ABC-type polysaccharide/polyol phosphate transport system ATPase subunit
MPLIEVENVSKVYYPRRGSGMLLTKGGFADFFRGRREKVVALEGISFEVERGESLGIIGSNGSGKSTLLKLLAGVTAPTSGRIAVRGRVASLLELGAGFHPLLTGRENIYLNARILGMDRRRVDKAFDRIVAFSGIGEFIDNPVNTYSSGMYVRLGFAVAAHADPDIFLVDEVLSVGDEEFQRKCRGRIEELKEQGKTLVFVSHDLSIVNTLCSRVILLSKGKMISRGTPQETIEFYLRQIGRETGIHTFAKGRVEAIFSHGRISVFVDGREVSAPAGFQMQVMCLGQPHESTLADWQVVERRPDGCVARGRMPRLPLSLLWDMRIENNQLVWRMGIVCEHEVAIEAMTASLFWPIEYAQWFYGDQVGVFPDIQPGDRSFTMVVLRDPACRETVAMPREGVALPPVLARLEAHNPYFNLQWLNTDYVLSARVLQASAVFARTDAVLRLGPHDLITIAIDLGLSVAEARDRARAIEAERTLRSGGLAARMQAGAVRVFHDETLLTATVHLHTQLRIANLWNMSHDLQWQPVQRAGAWMRATGHSPRFPFRQWWELEPAAEGMAFRVWLEVQDPLDVQEYNVSIGLDPAYDRWETSLESGVFPPFDPEQKGWRHLNKNYGPASRATALSPSLPSVTLDVSVCAIPFRMTAINSDYGQHTRVLQAIRVPEEAGVMHLERGRHLLFEGVVTVDQEPSGICKEEPGICG